MTRILSLDDSPEILKILHLFLELAGYEHLRAVESEAALSILRTEAVDMFTQDCIRPNLHGIELYKHLKADEKLRRIPVLFISAGERPEFAAECRSVYGDDYLTKPFQLETVLSTVAALLQRRGKHTPTVKERADRYAQIRAGLATELGWSTDQLDAAYEQWF
jgi:DNA-binding response OmpR family regulator